jgi:sec-independent protein translocase protein TatC
VATRLRPIGYDDRLSVVDHLDELRSRLIVCGITLAVAFAVCFWQNGELIHLLNRPLEKSTPSAQKSGNGRLASTAAAQATLGNLFARERRRYLALSVAPGVSPAARAQFRSLAEIKAAEVKALPKTVPKREPITTGVGEPFTVTLTVALYFALIFSLPVLLYQIYAFILPAFSPDERRVATPLMLGIPLLFVGGVVFGYFLVLPPAIKFLQNFNDNSFDVLIQAKDYYRFSIFTLLALGLVFQVPVGMLALARVGIVSTSFLLRNWRIEIVVIAIVAALLPGVDPVTTLLEMVPLLALFGLSILLVKLAERRRHDDVEEDDDVLEDVT